MPWSLENMAKRIWEAEHLQSQLAGQKLQRCIKAIGDSDATRTALIDLANSGRFTAEQLVAIRLLVLSVVITREKNRTVK